MAHIRVFALCVGLFFAFLAFLLFAVHMEAVAPASGVIVARDFQEVRTPLAGLIELGWYDGVLKTVDGRSTPVRLDLDGNGFSQPAGGTSREVRAYQTRDGTPQGTVLQESIRFHRLQPADEVWGGQPLASLRTEEWRHELDMLEAGDDFFSPGVGPSPKRIRRDALRSLLSQAVLRAPTSHSTWQVVTVNPAPKQNLAAGDLVATLVPWDPENEQPTDLQVRLKIDEGHFAEVARGQTVRIFSNVFHQRIYGAAEGVIERLEPGGEMDSDGQRRFVAIATLRDAPFKPLLGSTCRAEIVVGQKLVYRIVVEH